MHHDSIILTGQRPSSGIDSLIWTHGVGLKEREGGTVTETEEGQGGREGGEGEGEGEGGEGEGEGREEKEGSTHSSSSI